MAVTPVRERQNYADAVQALYDLHPLPGNRDNPRKAKGIKRIGGERAFYLTQIQNQGMHCSAGARTTSGIYMGHPTRLHYKASKLKIPATQLLTIHALLFP